MLQEKLTLVTQRNSLGRNICCGIIYKASEKSLVRKVINTAAPIAIETGTLIKINKIKPTKSKINILIIILTVR